MLGNMCMARVKVKLCKGVIKGGGGGVSKPPKNFRFFLKSEGKEVERIRNENGWRGGGVNC